LIPALRTSNLTNLYHLGLQEAGEPGAEGARSFDPGLLYGA
jgi:hypothetical protein